MATKIFQDQLLDYKDFSTQCLIGVKFINCSIRFCKFLKTDLSYAVFESCDLYKTQFNDSVLYHTKILNCEATKAIFLDSYLNGVRIQNTVVTYTEFGEKFKTSLERKSIQTSNVTAEYFTINTQELLPDLSSLETDYMGIHVLDANIAIQFINNENDKWRVMRRKSEIALTIKKILEENGYKDKSLHYYFLHRQYLRKAKKNSFFRFVDYVGNELFWGYGVKFVNPVVSFFVNCIIFSIIYSVLPLFDSTSGMTISGNIIHVIYSPCSVSFVEFFKVLYGSFLISSLSVFGEIDLIGYAKLFVVLHTMISVLLIGLGITALSKKLANS